MISGWWLVGAIVFVIILWIIAYIFTKVIK